jgi:competence protein ComEC
MRNLSLAALTVLAIEPESILGASFQLSFSAVTALVAVQEARVARRAAAGQRAAHVVDPRDPLLRAIDRARRGPLALLFATACATCGTASFMAYDFHELSPYVLIGNPLTLAVIEFFAVPCALVGALLYPLGLDALVWKYLGTGIAFILWAAGKLAVAPDSSVPIPAFSPLALLCLAFGLLHVAIWRTPALRLSGAPWVVLGLAGALASSAPASANISPTGDLIAVRGADGRLGIFGRRLDGFVADQWLSADGDPRPSAEAFGAAAQGDRVRCDRRLCLVAAPEETIALVLDPGMFEAACATADVVVSPLSAPMRCDAALVLDRDRLRATGAVELRFRDAAIDTVTARAPHEDRPWSPAPQER